MDAMKRIPVIVFCMIALSAPAQRQLERLDRGLVAVKTEGGVYVSWRVTGPEWYGTSYNLYRDGVKLNASPITGASNFVDEAGTEASTYAVSAVKDSAEGEPCHPVPVLPVNYKSIKLRELPVEGYEPNDATVADLDGDGEMEIILKRLYPDWSPSARHYSYIEAYKQDGTFLWCIDVGPNIFTDVETNVAAYDFDGDGKAEVFMRTSEGTVFGDGVQRIGDTNGDGIINYRSASWAGTSGNYPNYSTYLCDGPEFLSLIDGETGKELDRVEYIPRGNTSDWEDSYGHRANKFFFGAPYLDGKHPSLFISRGIYTRIVMRTYDVVDKKLQLRWSFDSNDHPGYAGQGNHNMTIADIDGDGCDEIVYGSMTVDHDGKGLYSTGLGHGDAIHVGDFDPYHKGLEVFACHEHAPYGTSFRDGRTGQILLRHTTDKDCGRCMAANVTNDFPGAGLWGGRAMYSAVTRKAIEGAASGGSENFRIYWDGDLLEETFDYNSVSKATAGQGEGVIYKYGRGPIFTTSGCATNNHTKGNPCFQGDILGDWREEFIMRTQDNNYIRIYFTTEPTEHRIYTLLHDGQYRQALCWQMCGYNQPPHVSFFLGEREGILLPPPPAISNGKLLHDGSASWVSASWTLDGEPVVYSDGQSVLLDKCGTVVLPDGCSPGLLTVANQDSTAGAGDYLLEGGALCGTMALDKLGAGKLTLRPELRYEGPTRLWEGRTVVSSALRNSKVWMNRFAELDLEAEAARGIEMEYGAILRIGGAGERMAVSVGDSLEMKTGAELHFDLFGASLSSDTLHLLGDWVWEEGAVLRFFWQEGGACPGRYVLAVAGGSLRGRVEDFEVYGLEGCAYSLSAEGNALVLHVR